MLTKEELLRYNRQMLLPEFGKEGQERLKAGSVLVVGAGGLGSPALLYLAAAGLGRIGILDFDKVDVSNLQRQILYAATDAGSDKSWTAKEKLAALNPLIQIETHNTFLNASNAINIVSGYDVVIDGSDNLPTRYLVNDACVLQKKTLIYGAIFQFEGHVSVFNQPDEQGNRGPNYRDLFPDPPPPEMVPACNVSGVMGSLPGIIGTMQAHEAIKVIARVGTTLSGRLFILDSLDFSTRFVNVKRNLKAEPITSLIDYEAFCNPKSKTTLREITAWEVKKMLDGGISVQLIDVRESFEFELGNLGGSNIPVNIIHHHLHSISKDVPVILYCKSGQRSYIAARKLSDEGFKNIHHLKGGLIAWKNDVDEEFQLY